MLGKLMKHEFRATGRIILPLLAAELILAVLAGFSVRGLDNIKNPRFLDGMYSLTVGAFFLGMFAIFVVAFVLMIQRFYKSLLRDEGYLSMTLPVSVDEQIWAKLLVSFVWFLAVGALCLVSMFVVASIGVRVSLPEGLVLSDLWDALRAGVRELGGGNIALYFLEALAILFFGICSTCLRCYAAMAIGCSAADHKLALSFAAYFAIGIALSIVANGALFSVLPRMDVDLLFPNMSSAGALHAVMLGNLVICAGLSALFYFVTRYFLKNRLNLA